MAAALSWFWPCPATSLANVSRTHLPLRVPASLSLSSTFGSGANTLVSVGKLGSLYGGFSPAVGRGLRRMTPRAACNVVIAPEENEPEDVLVRRFRSKVLRAGVIQECKRRRFFENKQDERKRKKREAAKKNRKWRPQKKFQVSDKQEAPKKGSIDDEEEDNWEVPEVLPY